MSNTMRAARFVTKVWWCGCLGLALLLLALGCGGPATSTVSGTIKYKGKPLSGGVVTFMTMDGKASFPGPIDHEGHYKVEKVLRGQVRIGVTTSSQAMSVPLPKAALRKKRDNPMGIRKGMMRTGA